MIKPSRRRAKLGSPKRPAISVVVEESLWREDVNAIALIRRAARLALTDPACPKPLSRGAGEARGITILLAGDPKLRALNTAFRRKNKPTNVLSFPAWRDEPASLGDIALAHGVIAREARAQGKSFAHHAAHLALHGTLHLLGHDHEMAREAQAMEALERELLAKLGIPDPYAPRPYTRGRR